VALLGKSSKVRNSKDAEKVIADRANKPCCLSLVEKKKTGEFFAAKIVCKHLVLNQFKRTLSQFLTDTAGAMATEPLTFICRKKPPSTRST
jgi:hypothetical protein